MTDLSAINRATTARSAIEILGAYVNAKSRYAGLHPYDDPTGQRRARYAAMLDDDARTGCPGLRTVWRSHNADRESWSGELKYWAHRWSGIEANFALSIVKRWSVD